MTRFGFSFSWKRFFGFSRFKQSVARKTGVPTTKSGIERKIGKMIIDLLFGKK